MLSNKVFNGKLNLDDHPYRVPTGDYIDALNITRDAQGDGQDMVVSNIVGNALVEYVSPSGINKTIGNFPDKVRNRFYYLRWNNNGNSSILYYDKKTNSIIKVLISKTDSAGIDILNFNPSFRINHIDIIYRDEGDLLFWTDGLNPPSKINVDRATSGGYGTFIRSYLDVAKEIPEIPPAVVYENDATVTVNNLRKKLFKFKYEYEFDDLETSATSAHSELPLPVNYLDTNIDKDPTKNARIAIVVQTGADNVRKIRILASQSIGNQFSDFFLIKVIDKAEDGIANNDITTYRFYNDQAYIYVPIKQSILPFDYVPQKAFSQALPNGNVICYAAILEGYDLSTINATASVASITQRTTQLPFIFVGSQSGNSGFGIGVIHVVVIGSVAIGDRFNIITTNQTITFTATVATTANVIAGIAAAAIVAAFTVVSSDTQNLRVVKTGESLLRISTIPVIRTVTDSFVFDYSSRYNWAIEYFDEKGRTPSSITSNGMAVQTLAYTEIAGVQSIPKILLSISSRPPLYAKYYHILVTKNLSKSKILYWVSDRTFKDSEYAYIGIDNLNIFIKKNPTTPLGYKFLQNDRITFIKCLSNGGFIYTNQDFDIVSDVFNPEIQGIIREGQFIKIALPTITGTFDFGTSPFYNYFIELYTPAQSVANGLDVYYEISERYAIGNPSTNLAFHQGMLQNQSSDLLTPATFEFTKGDDYYRIRTISTGVELSYAVTTGVIGDGRFTLGVNFVSSTYTDVNLLTGNSPLQNLVGFVLATNDTRWLLKVVNGSYTFNIKGTINCVFSTTGEDFSFYLQDNLGNVTYLVSPQFITQGPHIFTFDTNFVLSTISGQTKIFIFGFSSLDITNSKTFFETDITITRVLSYSVGVIDPNFSDFFPSAVNSYGRAWTVDENAKQTFYPSLIRFGQEFQENTSINEINRFYFDNQDNYDRANGVIRKLFVEGRRLFVFQEFDIGIVPILTQIVKDTSGNPLEANSDVLLNKIAYPYIGKFGIGDVPESFSYGKGAKYFVDSNKGVICRLSQDGITVLSILYKTNSFFVKNLTAYKKGLNTGIVPIGQTYTGDPTVYGVFDAYTNKYIVALEEINRYSNPNTLIFHQDPYTITFLETRDSSEGFESFCSFFPENMGCLDNLLVTFKNGDFWKHDSLVFCNFYAQQYDVFIKPVFNDAPLLKKTFLSITESANTIWDCPEIETQLISFGNTAQQSILVIKDFKRLENMFHASFLRDMNSIKGIINGDSLKGNYIIVKFRVENASEFIFMNLVSLKYINSPLTNT